jgi:hypothetical protein
VPGVKATAHATASSDAISDATVTQRRLVRTQGGEQPVCHHRALPTRLGGVAHHLHSDGQEELSG